MIGTKKYIYSGITVFLLVVFLSMTVYSLWFGAKNNEDIISVADCLTVASDSSGTGVFHHSLLDKKDDINEYHWLVDDSIPLRFAGYISKFINPLFVWIGINLVSVALMVYMLYSLISRWNRGFLRNVLIWLFLFVPVFFRGSTQLGAYTLLGALLLATVYIGAVREASVIKWYLVMTLCAVVVSFLPEFIVIVYIIPFVAYKDIKNNYNGGKAASHILFLLMLAVVIHFMFLRAFDDYTGLYYALTKRSDSSFAIGFRNFFYLDTKEKIGIYLPVNIMAIVSLYGLFSVEKYVKKYIYPGVFLYLWTIVFAGNNSYILSVIYPVLFFAFSQTVIHTKVFRGIKNILSVSLCITLAVCMLCCATISYRNHIKGLKVAYLTDKYAGLYKEYVQDKSTVLSVDDEDNLAVQMYAAYPKKTILSVFDDKICPEIIGTYYPEYIVSRYQLNYAEYENVFFEEEKYVYKLKVK